MVQSQLCSLEHLMNSGFGRPFPRHGLQLLFWFANDCVTCELTDCVVSMQLVSDCQPERGFCGFHPFGNVEELLPVLNSPRKVVYFEVGNLNTETYPASANLPTYVRENYGSDCNCGSDNIDRIIISCQVRTTVVETVYVTEHDRVDFGRFSRDRTYEIGSELIQALQNPKLDLTTFLTQVGYFEVVQASNIEEIHYPESSAQQMFDMVQTYSDDFLTEAFHQQLDVTIEPFSYKQHMHYIVTPHNNGLVANYSEVQHKYRKPKASKRQRALREYYWQSEWEQLDRACDDEAKKRRRDGGISFFKLLLSAGALCLAVRCFSWLRSWWKADLNENLLKMVPWKTPSYQRAHIMLDYVY
uniref:Uncharacterized protein n=1 Tax=Monopterus albus TaxID=43700 RepID=A0A3Q3KDI0_MONAL|nr:uncharacterized protein LOC109952111 [Monopterus albus]